MMVNDINYDLIIYGSLLTAYFAIPWTVFELIDGK